MATDEVAQANPEVPISPSALKVATVLPASSAIGSLSAMVIANADLISPRWAFSTPYSSSSPVTTRFAEDSQLALAFALSRARAARVLAVALAHAYTTASTAELRCATALTSAIPGQIRAVTRTRTRARDRYIGFTLSGTGSFTSDARRAHVAGARAG